MESAIATPFKCKNHDSVYLKIRDTLKNPPTCGSCGFKCEGRSGFISCPTKATCFSLCTVCKVCPSNHFLRKSYNLTVFSDKNTLYAENKFVCNGCTKEKNVPE